MNILICNERLLARFGVDRLLFIIGKDLVDAGHRVTLVALRGDSTAASGIGPLRLVDLPAGMDIASAERYASEWIEQNWQTVFEDGTPDLLLSGGWPFFSVSALGNSRAVPSLFIDAGAVPHDGFPEAALPSQRELRRVRATRLPEFTGVLPISEFIRSTQTIADRGHARDVTTILLGADHLEHPLFAAPAALDTEATLLADCRGAVAAGCHLILGLGRYESYGYKNSPALLSVFERTLRAGAKAKLLLLAAHHELEVPEHLAADVVLLGHVSDDCLAEIIRMSTLTLSTSLWEGFNLPLAESQWFSVPCLAFGCGAHAEVTAHPWYLCNSASEMSQKAVLLMAGEAPAEATAHETFDRFRARFGWHSALGQYRRVIEALGVRPWQAPSVANAGQRPLLLIDCTNSAVDPANPGVIRVARRLSHCLQQAGQFIVLFMRWDKDRQNFVTLSNQQTLILSRYNGPQDHAGHLFGEARNIDEVLAKLPNHVQGFCFFPEVVLDGNFPERVLWSRVRHFDIAAFLHDIIPISHAPLCARDVVANFPEYLKTISTLDVIIANSYDTRRTYLEYCSQMSLPNEAMCEALWLPAQFSDYPRQHAEPVDTTNEVLALCVASLDPRKNHRTLIEAFKLLRERKPSSRLRLTLVGNRFGSSDILAQWVMQQAREVEGLEWTGLLSDHEVEALMNRAAFTVYPSIVEGFGLPIVESLWMGRPCLCHNAGVMSELASLGGCETVDMKDPVALADTLQRFEESSDFRQRLIHEIRDRTLADWQSYAHDVTSVLARYGRSKETAITEMGAANAFEQHRNVAPVYPIQPAGTGVRPTIPQAIYDRLSVTVASVESARNW